MSFCDKDRLPFFLDCPQNLGDCREYGRGEEVPWRGNFPVILANEALVPGIVGKCSLWGTFSLKNSSLFLGQCMLLYYSLLVGHRKEFPGHFDFNLSDLHVSAPTSYLADF
jgi:hypothetical protein